jgi:hypothetical protein
VEFHVSERRRDSALANPARLRRLLRRDGIVEVPMTASEQRKSESGSFQTIVAEWPAERIAALETRCRLPKSRIAALLSIGVSALTSIGNGKFTPSPALCRRMDQLEQMADRGELHGEYVADKTSLQRRLTIFRAWFFEKPPTADFPLVTVAVRIKWGKSRYHEVLLPVEGLPSLRLTRWAGLVQVVKAVTMAVRELARANSRLLWKDVDEQFWRAYAMDTLPGIVEERARVIESRRKHAI